MHSRGRAMRRRCAPGSAASQVTQSLTPVCASSGRPAGCTIASAWWWARSWSSTCSSIGPKASRWFWDTLVDADPANNPASWQWVAGCGADAAPYFRIFNPVLQGEKFDPDGRYVREFVPELARLPNAVVHKPWTAPPLLLREAGVTLGKTYPESLVEHAQARQRALAAFERLKKQK